MRRLHSLRQTMRVLTSAALGIATFCAVAQADELLPIKQVSVADRPRPEYESEGLRVGGLRVSPSLSIGESYDDNVFALDEAPLSDSITKARGALSIRSETRIPWSLFGDVTSAKYADHSSEDHTDWQAGASLAQPIGLRTRATLQASLASGHTPRDDTSFPLEAAELPAVRTRGAALDFVHPFASGQLSLSANLQSDDYADVKRIGGGSLDQDFRDRDEWTWDARTDFAVGSSSALFVRYTHRQQRYEHDDPSGLDRDARSDAVYGGTAFLITNLMRADVGVGALRVNNADPTQRDRTSLALSSDLEFYLSQLVTATVELRRSSGAADIEGSSSFIATSGALGLDYEWRRNVIVSLRLSRSQRDYSGLDDTDDSTDFGLDIRWLMNRHARLSLGATREQQDWAASNPGRKFHQNVYAASFDWLL